MSRLKSAKTWEKAGVPTSKLRGALPRDEQETALSFLATDKQAEVTTADPAWQRRLENDLECVPCYITLFESGTATIRYYPLVPVKYIRMPAKGRLRKVKTPPQPRPARISERSETDA